MITSNVINHPVYSQLTNGSDIPRISEFLEPNDQFDIPISYPIFWDKVLIPEVQTALFLSPLKTVGALVQHLPQVNAPVDEFITNLLLLLRNNLQGLNFTNSESLRLSDGSKVETLEFTFGNGSNIYKVLQIMKFNSGEMYSVTYFADEGLYSRFLPIIKKMMDSVAKLPDSDNKLINMKGDNVDSNISSIFNSQSYSGDKSQADTSYLSDIVDVFPGSQLLEYNNPYLGISLNYPPSFSMRELDNGVSFTFDDGFSGLIMMVNPTKAQSLEDFAIEHLSELQSVTDNFTLVGTDQDDIFEKPTQISLFNYYNNSQPYQAMEFVTLDDQDAYVFNYYSHNSTFDNNVEQISNIWDSVNLRNLQRLS
jgi:hypothetical protein